MLQAQQKYTLSGYIKDSLSSEELIGASIYVEELKTGVTTNTYGFFSLTLPSGKYQLRVQYLGFEEKTIALQ
jgi:hypothetical protein